MATGAGVTMGRKVAGANGIHALWWASGVAKKTSQRSNSLQKRPLSLRFQKVIA